MVGRLPEWATSERTREVGAPLVVVALGVILYAPLLWGDLPVNHDHPILLLRAWIFGQHLASSGAPWGFSPILGAGNPVDGMYPVGTDLLVGFFKLVTFGLASWQTAYCWALLTSILVYPGALYALGRRVGGPLAGLTAGVLALVDRGDYLQSGWDFSINWGVWAMGLSFSLCLLVIWALDRLAERPSRGRIAALALLSGGALVGHPMAIPILGIVIPLQLAWTAASRGFRTAVAWLPSALLAFVIGGGLAAFWYAPFLAHGDWFEPLGLEWHTFGDVLTGLADGTVLNSFAPAFVPLGLLGLIWAALRRDALGATFLLATAVVLYVSSNTFLVTFDVLHKLPGVANVQLERFSYFVRAALLLGVGLFAAFVVREAWQVIRGGPAATRPSWFGWSVRAVVGAVVLVPFLLSAPGAPGKSWFIPSHRLAYASDDPVLPAVRDAADYLKNLDPGQVGRIALNAARHEHRLMLLPLYSGLPVFKIGFTPENNYRFRPESADPVFRKALGISHVLTLDPMPLAGLEPVRRFGDLFLYRVKDFAPQRVALHGPGSAVVLRDEPEALDVRLAGTVPGTDLEIYVGRYALWHAAMDGEPVAVEGASAGDSPPMFMKVPARDGLLTLRYQPGAAEIGGLAATLVALLGVVLLLALQRATRARAWWEARSGRWWAALARVVTVGTGVLAGVAVAGGIALLAGPGPEKVPGREVVADLSQRLDTGSAEIVRPGGAAPCSAWDGTRFQCPVDTWNYIGKTLQTVDGLMRQCVWMHPVEGGRLTLHLPGVPLGNRLEGHFGLHDVAAAGPNRANVRVSVQVAGQPAHDFTAPGSRGWREWSVDTTGLDGTVGDVTVSVETASAGQRHFCLTMLTTRAGQ